MASLSYKIIATPNNHNSSDIILNEILRSEYDTRLEKLYETRLSQVEQINFRYIEQYREEIKQLAKRLIICAEPAIKDTSKIIDKQSIRGLHPTLKCISSLTAQLQQRRFMTIFQWQSHILRRDTITRTERGTPRMRRQKRISRKEYQTTLTVIKGTTINTQRQKATENQDHSTMISPAGHRIK